MKFDHDPTAVLPTGFYQFVITKYEEKEASEEGKYPYAIVTVSVVTPADNQGELHNELFSFSPKASFKFKNLLEACQIPFEIGREYGESDLVGKSFMGLVEHREYQGKKQAQIKEFKVVGAGAETDFGGSNSYDI